MTSIETTHIVATQTETIHRLSTHLLHFALAVTIQVIYIWARTYLKRRKNRLFLKFFKFRVEYDIYINEYIEYEG
jgi:hypothetical protein